MKRWKQAAGQRSPEYPLANNKNDSVGQRGYHNYILYFKYTPSLLRGSPKHDLSFGSPSNPELLS